MNQTDTEALMVAAVGELRLIRDRLERAWADVDSRLGHHHTERAVETVIRIGRASNHVLRAMEYLSGRRPIDEVTLAEITLGHVLQDGEP